MVNDFFYKQPVRIWFGEGKFQQLESVMAELGCKKCVLVCGRHFAPEAKAMMEKMPAIAAVYGEVEQNPQLAGVEETVRLARSLGADTIVGIGGGSSMDTAKFAAAAAP
ncbi:MAG: iron-containing alcohol dehydrogenase, partial [Eubacteriales bacterium]|nr:iron-containing alcohol dehydrogenase [Eubacteriales bacterium]